MWKLLKQNVLFQRVWIGYNIGYNIESIKTGRSARDNDDDDDDDDVDADDDHGDDGDDIGDDNNQEPIIRSGQLSCTCDTAFSPASYFFNPAN